MSRSLEEPVLTGHVRDQGTVVQCEQQKTRGATEIGFFVRSIFCKEEGNYLHE